MVSTQEFVLQLPGTRYWSRTVGNSPRGRMPHVTVYGLTGVVPVVQPRVEEAQAQSGR